MTFFEAAQEPLGKLLVFDGRSSRKEFWSFLLAILVVAAAIGFGLRAAAPDLLIPLVLPVTTAELLLIWPWRSAACTTQTAAAGCCSCP